VICSTAERLLTDEKAAQQRKEHNPNHEGKAGACRRSIAPSHNPANIWIKRLDKVKTLPYSVYDAIDVLAAVQRGA